MSEPAGLISRPFARRMAAAVLRVETLRTMPPQYNPDAAGAMHRRDSKRVDDYRLRLYG